MDESKTDRALREIADLRQSMKTDFEFNAMMMGNLAADMTALGDSLQKALANMSERMTQVEGRMRLQESRFDKMLEAVQSALEEGHGERVTRG
ncbi:MAG: hypothetical protein AB1758_04095 [Candidatus Eremiobacterota bacterium]